MASQEFPPPPLPDNIALLAGPQLLGFLFSWGLQGVLSVQVYIYHMCFPKDRLAIKLFVYGILIWEWVQTALITQVSFEFDVYHFGDIGSLTSFHSSWFSVPVMSAITSGIVQSYYAYRIYVLSHSKLLVSVIGFLAFAQTALGVAGGVALFVVNAGALEDALNRPLISAGLILSTIVDVTIAAVMTYLLLRSKAGIKSTDDIVNRLVRLVIETGALTAAVQLVYVILFMLPTDNLLYQCPSLVLPKLYSNTLVVSLNNRVFMRGQMSNISESASGSAGIISMPAVFSRNLTRTETGGRRGGADVASRRTGRQAHTEVHIEVAEDTYITHDDAPSKTTAVELVPMGDRDRDQDQGSESDVQGQYGDYKV